MTVQALRHLFDDSLTQIPDEYIQSVIDEYDLDIDETNEFGWDKFIIKKYNSGHRFGCDVGKMLNIPTCDDNIEDFIKEIDRLVISKKIYNDIGMFTEKYTIVDFSAGKVFHTVGNIGSDYTKYDNSELDKMQSEKIVSDLKVIVSELERTAAKEPVPVFDCRIILMSKEKKVKKYYLKDVAEMKAINGFVENHLF